MTHDIPIPTRAARAPAEEPEHLHFDRQAGVWRTHQELAPRDSVAPSAVALPAPAAAGGGRE